MCFVAAQSPRLIAAGGKASSAGCRSLPGYQHGVLPDGRQKSSEASFLSSRLVLFAVTANETKLGASPDGMCCGTALQHRHLTRMFCIANPGGPACRYGGLVL
ncbi:unnamed protein product [Ectocarpus sp. 12 AP-2014]